MLRKRLFFAVFSVLVLSNFCAPAVTTAAPDVFDNVPEAQAEGYQLVYTLPIENLANYNIAGSVPYSVDNSATITGPFDRIAYYLELDDGTGLIYAYASMDAFTNNVDHVGIPIASNVAAFQQLVSNMNIYSNSIGVATGTGIETGNIEFWPNNYGTTNQLGIPNASDSSFDFGDLRAGSGNYGSFQIHNHGASETIFAYNQWGGYDPAANGDLGIGNSTDSARSDWTFAGNASSYTIKNLQILVRPSGLSIDSGLQRAIIQRDTHNQASIPITGHVASGITSIEARAVPRPGGGGVATGWKVIDSGPSGNSWSGMLSLAGGWYDVEVRSLNGTSVVDQRMVERVGVGDVFIVAGQSNSANHGSDILAPVDDRVSTFNLSSWRLALDPQPIATGSGGSPWPALGDAIAADEGVPVGFITVGWGGTTVAQWVPGASGPDAQPLYERLKAALLSVGPDGARAVLWHQGESDNYTNTTMAEYVQRLETIIAQSRIDAGFDIPWGVAQATFIPPNNIQQSILDAQAQVAANDPLNFVGPLTDDLTGPTWRAPDAIHFNETGLREHAARWHMAINNFFQETGTAVAPDASKLLDGVTAGGQLSDLGTSDDVDLMLDPSPTKNPLKQRVDIILLSELSTVSPNSFSFCVEAAMLGGPSVDVIQTVRLWNVADKAWDILDVRVASIQDAQILVRPAGDPTDYVHQITGEVVARLTWESPEFDGKPYFWSVDVDQAIWLVGQ